MISNLLLLDVAPDPVSTGVGLSGLVLIEIVVVMLAAAALLGGVFLFTRLRRRRGAATRLVVGDVCLNLDNVSPQSNQSSLSERPFDRIR